MLDFLIDRIRWKNGWCSSAKAPADSPKRFLVGRSPRAITRQSSSVYAARLMTPPESLTKYYHRCHKTGCVSILTYIYHRLDVENKESQIDDTICT